MLKGPILSMCGPTRRPTTQHVSSYVSRCDLNSGGGSHQQFREKPGLWDLGAEWDTEEHLIVHPSTLVL